MHGSPPAFPLVGRLVINNLRRPRAARFRHFHGLRWKKMRLWSARVGPESGLNVSNVSLNIVQLLCRFAVGLLRTQMRLGASSVICLSDCLSVSKTCRVVSWDDMGPGAGGSETTRSAGANPRGYNGIFIPKIAVHCISKGQDSKCGKFPTWSIYNLSLIYTSSKMQCCVRKRHGSVKAKFHYAIQLSSSLAGRRPGFPPVADRFQMSTCRHSWSMVADPFAAGLRPAGRAGSQAAGKLDSASLRYPAS